MSRHRPPAVSGTFYPGEPRALADLVTQLLEEADSGEDDPSPPKAVIAPHAGYAYSGPVAATAFRCLAGRPRGIRRIVLLGPSHFVPLRGLALAGCGVFDTPLGGVPLDGELAAAVSGLTQVGVHPAAHAHEHSLEVELPFLQVLLGEFTVLPLVVGDAPPVEVAEVLDAVWDGGETRIVISSDLSHYLPYGEAVAADEETARAIVELRGPLESHQACGSVPVNGLLHTAWARGLETRLLDLRNSGDTRGGRDRVVGYGAFGFWERAGAEWRLARPAGEAVGLGQDSISPAGASPGAGSLAAAAPPPGP